MAGWGGLFSYVIAFDVWCIRRGRRSLSTCFRSAPRTVTLPVSALICAHLFGVLPERYDPLCRLAGFLTPIKEPRL